MIVLHCANEMCFDIVPDIRYAPSVVWSDEEHFFCSKGCRKDWIKREHESVQAQPGLFSFDL